MHRSTTARALIICTIVLGLSSIAAPALAGHDSDDPDGYSEEYGSDERAGRGSHLQIEVECDSVEATSKHKISTVTVYFTDGTEEEIEVDEREYSATFTNTIDHAIAEAHKEWVTDDAKDCDAEPEPSDSPDDEGDDEGDEGDDDEETADAGDEDSDSATSSGSGNDDASTGTGGGSDGGTGDDRDGARQVASTSTTSSDDSVRPSAPTKTTSPGMTAGTATSSSPTVGSGSAVAGNAKVFGMIFHQGLKTCPSGPFKGMPYVDIKDCGDSVLGTRLAATGSGTGIFTALGFALVAMGTLLLRLRRSRGAA